MMDIVADIEKYVIEIVCRSRTIQSRCRKLLSREFVSASPLYLAETILKLCRQIEAAAVGVYRCMIEDSENNYPELVSQEIKALKLADNRLHFLGAHLRFVDGSIAKKLPWSIIKPIEKLSGQIIRETSFMFRPQWKYNFSVLIDDLREKYRDIAETFEIISGISKESVLSEFNTPFYIVSFPSIERKNILLQCLLGHELGHLIVKDIVNEKLGQGFLERIGPAVKQYVMKDYDIDPSNPDMFKTIKAKSDVEAATNFTLNVWQRGLEEILSDIIGTLIFGPAMLFSIYELSFQKTLDHTPDSSVNFYPAWRFRLREIIKVLQRPGAHFFPIEPKHFSDKKIHTKINRSFDIIKAETEKENDLELIREHELTKIAYKEIETDLSGIVREKKYFRDQLNDVLLTPQMLYKDIEHLIMRLDNGLPPNAIEHTVKNRHPATLVEIINAAWFFKLSRLSSDKKLLDDHGNLNNQVIEDKDIMNRLTLKAIEYAEIEAEYSSRIKNGPTAERMER